MGGRLLRRKAVALLLGLGVAVLSTAGAEPAVVPVPAAAPGAAGPGTLGVAEAPAGARPPAGAASRSVPQPLHRQARPPVQGHAGPAVLSIAAPEAAEPGGAAVERIVRDYLTVRRPVIEGSLRRAHEYRRFVSVQIAELGLPPELLYLPVVESGWRPRAVSRSGAAGLWQFMRNTATPFGLRSDEWLDERRDFWLATGAALRKLRENHTVFGDWPLALASYNRGVAGLKRNMAQGDSRDFWTLRARGALPWETADYVPRFLAVAIICSTPGRYGFPLDWEPSPAWDRLQLERSVDLRILARVAGVPYEVLREGNAELNYPLTPSGNGGYWLKFPASYRPQVERALGDPEVKLVRLHPHPVRSGDTLYALSQRFGVSIAMIQSYNPQVDPQRIQIGSRLFIPVLGDKIPEDPLESSRPRLVFGGKYTVQAGDTLWGIAIRYGTTPEDLARENNRALEAVIRPGENLRVPSAAGADH